MALSISQTAALSGILKPGMRVASMGYPDLIAPMQLIENLLGDRIPESFRRQLEFRQDSSEICRRHGLKDRPIPDAKSLFRLLGCELDVYDIVRERGCEIIRDLNYPIAEKEAYDIVLDVGTMEHCFNIAQAAFNMAGLVKRDGIIIHENPFCAGNHGFYGLNPTWYHDFYLVNGFRLMECKLVTKDGRSAMLSATKRFQFVAEEANIFAMAQRLEIRELVYPTQTKYAKLIPVAGVRAEVKEAANA